MGRMEQQSGARGTVSGTSNDQTRLAELLSSTEHFQESVEWDLRKSDFLHLNEMKAQAIKVRTHGPVTCISCTFYAKYSF